MCSQYETMHDGLCTEQD